MAILHGDTPDVSVIVRFTFGDVLHAERLDRKLAEAGVPKAAAEVHV